MKQSPFQSLMAFTVFSALFSSFGVAGEFGADVPVLLDSSKSGASILEKEDTTWHHFNLEGNYTFQNQYYRITGFDADFEIPEIEVPEIEITNADVNHLIPQNLPPFIREPLLAQARAAAQKEAERIAEEQVEMARAMIPSFDANTVKSVENTVHTVTMKLGFSPVRFANVFGILGRTDGEVDVTLAEPFEDLTVGYKGLVYGAGATVAVGTDKLFASMTGVYTIADLDGGSSIKTWVLTPKIGVHNDRGALWIGAHHQATSHMQDGSIDVEPVGPVNFAVALEDEFNWNMLAGGRLNIGEHAYLMAEGGFGHRAQAIVAFGFDFW